MAVDASNSRSKGRVLQFHRVYMYYKPTHATFFSQSTTRQLWVGSALQATAGERRIATLLTEKLTPTYIEVRDISGEGIFHIQRGDTAIHAVVRAVTGLISES